MVVLLHSELAVAPSGLRYITPEGLAIAPNWAHYRSIEGLLSLSTLANQYLVATVTSSLSIASPPRPPPPSHL